MDIDKSKIRSILFITLSNLGDIILTTPVLTKLHKEFPDASIDVITGQAGEGLFREHGAVNEVKVNKKRRSLKERIDEVLAIRHRKYDMVIDLKNSLLPYLSGAGVYSRLNKISKDIVSHKRDEHLSKLIDLGITPFFDTSFFIPVKEAERKHISEIIENGERRMIVVINPGAKSHLKRWPAVKYAQLSDQLVTQLGARLIITGNDDDVEVVKNVTSGMSSDFTDLCCKTTVGELFELMRQSSLVITNDSAPLHIASAAGVSTIALFGPTDDRKYGPLGDNSCVIKPDFDCMPCEKSLCGIGLKDGCVGDIKIEDVFQAAKGLLTGS